MIQYKYHRAASLDDVVKVLKEYGGKARIVAGGTDIMVQIHEKDKRWKDLQCLLDITYLDKELRYISQDEEYVYIGPLSTHTDLEQSEIIAKHIPFLDGPAPPWVPRRYETAGPWAEASAMHFLPPTPFRP